MSLRELWLAWEISRLGLVSAVCTGLSLGWPPGSPLRAALNFPSLLSSVQSYLFFYPFYCCRLFVFAPFLTLILSSRSLYIEENLPSIYSITPSLSLLVPPIDYPETWQTPFRP